MTKSSDVDFGESVPADRGPFQYDAFISYSRRDVAAATQVETMLETFKLPRTRSFQPIRRRLRVFRDEGDLAGNKLESALRTNLIKSQTLVVLCSPACRASDFVDMEIRDFASSRGADFIVPVIIDGQPNNELHADPENWAFPDALNTLLGGTPLAPDLRPEPGDQHLRSGPPGQRELVKVVAGILDLDPEDLTQRLVKDRRRQIQRIVAALVVVIVALALGLWQVNAQRQEAERQRARAEQQADLATSRLLAAVANGLPADEGDLAIALAVAAHAAAPTTQANDALLRSLTQNPELMHFLHGNNASGVVDVAPDDSRIIVGDNEGALIQWDLRSHKAAVFSDGGLPIGAMDYSPDGQVVYLIRQGLPSQVSSIETWDAATARRLSEMQLPHHILNDVVALDHDNAIITGNGSSDGVTDPDFLVRWQWTDNTVHPLPNASPTGQVVPVVAGLLMERHVTNRPRELLVVDPRSNAPLSEPIELGDDYLVDLDSTPDRRFAVALAGQAILLIDGSSGRLVERRSVAMNPVGARFVGNSRLAVMIASGLGVPRTGEGIHSFEVPSLTESPFVIALNTLSRDMSALHDSPVVLNSRIGGGVALWNFRAGAEFPGSFSRALTPHAEVPDSVSFAPDGATVFIASGSSVSAVAWDDATNRWPTKELGSPFRIHASSVRPDGRVLAVGGENQHNSGLVILVNSETSQVIKKFDVGPTAVQRMAFSPNGRYLFIATGAILGIGHGNVLALDTTNGRTREFGGPQPPVDLTVVGDRVVWLAQDGRIGSCPVNFAPDCSPTELDLGLERYVGDVWVGLSNKIAPTGRGQEIALLEGHRVGLVDLAANKPSVHWLGSHLAAVNGLTADPRSATLASTDFNGELILWDLDSDQPLISPTDLEGISRRLWSTYSPSGSELLLVNEAGLRSIKGNPRSWPDLACGIAGRNLTADEWNTYVGTGREREQPCPTP